MSPLLLQRAAEQDISSRMRRGSSKWRSLVILRFKQWAVIEFLVAYRESATKSL